MIRADINPRQVPEASSFARPLDTTIPSDFRQIEVFVAVLSQYTYGIRLQLINGGMSWRGMSGEECRGRSRREISGNVRGRNISGNVRGRKYLGEMSGYHTEALENPTTSSPTVFAYPIRTGLCRLSFTRKF